MGHSKPKGDISYYLEQDRYKKFNKYIGTNIIVPAARPIAYSTKADFDWLKYLKPLCKSWEELLAKVDGSSGEYIKSPDCVTVVKAFIEKKSDFNKVIWR